MVILCTAVHLLVVVLSSAFS